MAARLLVEGFFYIDTLQRRMKLPAAPASGFPFLSNKQQGILAKANKK